MEDVSVNEEAEVLAESAMDEINAYPDDVIAAQARQLLLEKLKATSN